MDYIEVALQQIERQEGVDGDILKGLIEGHYPAHERMVGLYERYRATLEGVPILTRQFEDITKINNKLNNDFFSDIVDTKVGYFAGKPISYIIDAEQDRYEQLTEAMDDFIKRNNVPDVDSETAKKAAITGTAARLLYVDREGNERVVLVPPWEAILLYESGMDEPLYGMRYYKVRRQNTQGEWQNVNRVEWYDDDRITYYVQNRPDGDFRLDDYEDPNPVPHNFDYVPLVQFANNEEQQGDCEKVLPLIDGYDNILSDANSEIEQFRLAYMAFYGIEVDEETLLRAKKTGAFNFPDKEGKMEFVTKMLDDNVVEHHLDRLEENIMRFSKSVNFGDEQFAGNQSGVSLRFKMLALESKCITAERKFTAALRQQFKILASAWVKRGLPLDYMDIDFQFTRNFPLNLGDEAETTTKLRGQVSEQTRLSMLSFIEDPAWELEQMQAETQGMVDLDQPVEDEADEPIE